jgi:hypothetical protein
VLIDIAPQNYGRVMKLFDYYPATATSLFGTNLSEAPELLFVIVWTSGQPACTNVNTLLKPKAPPEH